MGIKPLSKHIDQELNLDIRVQFYWMHILCKHQEITIEKKKETILQFFQFRYQIDDHCSK